MVTRSLKEKMAPYEKRYDRKPNLAHLRVFGCMAYAYVPDSNRGGELSKKVESFDLLDIVIRLKGNKTTSRVIIR